MAVQLSVEVRNARLDAVETQIGTAPVLKIWTGSPPATTATADSGTLLAQLTLPSNWMNAASSGSKTLLGTWQDSSVNNTGTAGHFRLYDSGVTTCHIQGTVTATGDGGDMTVNSISFNSGETFAITAFTLSEANS